MVSADAFAFDKSATKHNNVLGQPDYQIASLDLSHRWVDLVRNNQVQALVDVSVENGGDDKNDESVKGQTDVVSVRYGVRLAKATTTTTTTSSGLERFEEFVVEEGRRQAPSSQHIRAINETLSRLQSSSSTETETTTVQYKKDGDFVAQLQLVRTLRPPPSPGFSESTSSVPPPYKADKDSFVEGPLRLGLRPLVGTVDLEAEAEADGSSVLSTQWDIYHNVSPADTRGHFLLLPTLSDPEHNWRGQVFTSSDCNDLVHLADSIRPHGSLFLGFNSVGAGASQNHIHCHAWPSPPLPFLDDADAATTGWNCYAVSKVESIYDFCDIGNGTVECSYLKYPVFCVQLSASHRNLGLLAKALSVSLEAVGAAPYNIGFLNRPPPPKDGGDDDDDDNDDEKEEDSFVDVFLFARSKERSSVLPSLKLGVSEAMGVFHAQSSSELESLTSNDAVNDEDDGPMMKALKDISFEFDEDLWTQIRENLMELDSTES